MTRYAALERAALADALFEVGPDAPTLCAGWTARDLAAHVAVRERRPDAAAGIVVKPLAGWSDRVRRQYRDRYSFPELVALVRTPAWWSATSLPVLDEATNVVEFFVHTEDVRRGGPDRTPRDLPPGLTDALWRRVRSVSRLTLRRQPGGVRVVSPRHGEGRVGSTDPAVTITGSPGELLLFMLGRQRAAQVELTGPQQLTSRLSRARLGI
jgi:uncharacterized protein (TIGR03085 family)